MLSKFRKDSKIFVICTGWISAAWASGTSSIVLCHHVVRGDVTGRVRLCILENRRRQPERGFSVTFLIVPIAKLRVFPSDIHNNQVLLQLLAVLLLLSLLQELLEELARRIHNLFLSWEVFYVGGSNPWYPEGPPE